MTIAPIVLFVYNRPVHTQRSVEALQRNGLATKSDLYVFCDGPKTERDQERVSQVRLYVQDIKSFKSVTIVQHKVNLGLARSVITGVNEIVAKHGRIIVLEDDLVSSPHFLTYMNEALDQYQDENKVISIHGYVFPVKKHLPPTFFLRGADCWGWGTWKRGWDLFEPDGGKLLMRLKENHLVDRFDMGGAYPYTKMLKKQIQGQNDSWAIRWYASAFLHDKLTLYPGISLIHNIGNDSSGIHSGITDAYCTRLADTEIPITSIPIREDPFSRQEIERFLRSLRPGLLRRSINKFRAVYRGIFP